MAVYRCEYCDSALPEQERFCPGCGAPNPHFDPAAPAEAVPQGSRKPRTIPELQAFCRMKNMPLERMRFFIGQDERSPRAFGIYREGSDFIVYKNKSDGSRAIRYRGPDEAFAVNEIYQKLLEEHRKRAGGNPSGASNRAPVRSSPASGGKRGLIRFLPVILVLLGYLIFSVLPGRLTHRNDGYYRVGQDLFYHYGTSWFLDSGAYGDDGWTEIDDFPYDDYGAYYQGSSYDSDWGGSDFTDSWVWDELNDSSDSDWDSDWDDSDYDDWDSGDTDWDSDW